MARRLLLLLVGTLVAALIAVGCGGGGGGSGGGGGGQSCANPTLKIFQVLPSFGYSQQPTAITVLGSGFVATPTLFVGSAQATSVSFIGQGSITGVVPAGIAVGPHSVVVTNPNGACGELSNGFTSTSSPAPRIFSVSPGSVPTSYTGNVLVTGTNFFLNATLALISGTGGSIALVVDTAAGAPTSTSVNAAPAGHNWNIAVNAYLVKLTNPDTQFDRYSALVVTNPSGKLSTWTSNTASLMSAGRVFPGAAEATDDLSRRFIYAIGGSNGSGFLSSVEVSQTDLFGNLGPWSVDTAATLVAKRWGPGVTRFGDHLYVAAGTGTSGALASIETATVLPSASAPKPGALSAWTASIPSGTLALAYARAAVMYIGAKPYLYVVGADALGLTQVEYAPIN